MGGDGRDGGRSGGGATMKELTLWRLGLGLADGLLIAVKLLVRVDIGTGAERVVSVPVMWTSSPWFLCAANIAVRSTSL